MSAILLFSFDDDVITPPVIVPPVVGFASGTEAWARELVAQQFMTAWPIESLAALGAAVPCSLEGETVDGGDRFADCWFQQLAERQLTLGDHPLIEYSGLVYIRIWTPNGDEGRLDASKLADAARRVFTRKQLSTSPVDESVVIRTASAPQSRVDGRWYMQMLSWPFRYHARAVG